MNKFYYLILILLSSITQSFAFDSAKLNLKIKSVLNENRYFFCIYSAGCFSMKAGNHGKLFVLPAMDMSNILKFVIANGDTMRTYTIPSNTSCQVKINNGQKLNISGQLLVQHHIPTIKNLHCQIS